jgi:hypothetical protein
MQLQTYHFFDESDSEERRLGVVMAYGTALEYIELVERHDQTSQLPHYFPTVLPAMFETAAVIVMKVVNSSYAIYVDVEKGRRAFNYIVLLARLCSVQDSDLQGRISRILAQLWNVHQAQAREQPKPPGLRLKSRGIGSVIQDSVWTWRERFGNQPDNGRPSIPAPVVSSVDPVETSDEPFALPTMPMETASITNLSGSNMGSGPVSLLGNDTLNQQFDASAGAALILGDADYWQEDHDWMWNVGYPSLTGVDMPVNPFS